MLFRGKCMEKTSFLFLVHPFSNVHLLIVLTIFCIIDNVNTIVFYRNELLSNTC